MATRVAGRARSVPRKSKPVWVKYLKRTLAVTALAVLLGGSAGGFMLIAEFKKAAKRIQDLPSRLDDISSTPTEIYASDGSLLYRASPVYRKPIETYEEIPPLVIHATLAAEDKRFFEHNGVDNVAAARSIITNLRDRRAAQGGSTITMQLCKRLYTNSEKSFQRKLGDVCMAIEMERMLTKKEILRHYLNQVFYGQGAYGIKAAAQVYFGKSLKNLTPGEAAMLARCVRRPSEENPYVDLDKATDNRDTVLGIMRDEGWLPQPQYDKAVKEKVKLKPRYFESGERIIAYPYFTRYVLDYLHDHMPDLDYNKGGYKIYTTLDPKMQNSAEEAVHNIVGEYKRSGIHTAAFLLMDNTGKVLAMQGGLDYKRNQFNVITQGYRQPGSSFKPFIYSTALATGAISPGDRISNEPFDLIPGWHPGNSNGKAGGSFSIGGALQNSINLCAIWVTYKTGPEVCAKYCRDVFGFTDEKIEPVMSMALGTNVVHPIEMAEAYTIFQTGGDRVEARPITKIVDQNDTVVKTFKPEVYKYQLDAGVANQMDTYLRGVVEGGTATRALVIKDARGKTGTTQDNKDAWFCGYTNNLIGVGWVANENWSDKEKRFVYTPMSSRIFGGTHTIQMWTHVMKDAQAKYGRGTRLNGEPMGRGDVEIETTARKPDPADTDTPVRDNTAVPDETKNAPPANDIPATIPDTKTIPKADKPPERQPETRPREESNDEVSVEVCAETGLKATIYCPETVTRRYPRGKEPRRWCRKHSQ